MINLRNQKGLTIIELVISVIILFFIMMGVGAIDQALKRTHTTSQRSSQVVLQVSAAMLHISNNAALAIGDKTSEGIKVIAPEGNPWWELKIRQDDDQTPWDYGDDKWVRYINGGSGDLTVCMDWDDSGGSCNNAAVNQYKVATGIVYDDGGGGFEQYKFEKDAANSDLYLEVTLIGRDNLAKAKDVIKNPEVTQSTKIHLPGHTWSDAP